MRDFTTDDQPISVRIRGFGSTVAASGVFLTPGRDKNLRKLEPNEVVRIYPHEPCYDVALTLINGRNPIIEVTTDAPTRPLRWPNPRLARWSSAAFTPGKENEREAKAKALAMVDKLIAAEANEWERAQTQIDDVRAEREAEEERALQARQAEAERQDLKRQLMVARRNQTLAQKALREAAEVLDGATDDDRAELVAARNEAQSKLEEATALVQELEERETSVAAAA